MGIDIGQVVAVHADALQLRAERTKVLASNLANVNTPGYQARDIDFAASLERVMSEGGEGLETGDGGELMYRVPHHPSADGNTVELGVEQAAFAQNAVGFQTSLTFVQMKFKGLAQAIAGQ
jgi:flagellar basal-body rod protein FlgB